MARECRVCGHRACRVAVPPEWPPFAVARLYGREHGDSLWFNVPMSLNWNWYNIDSDGLWCWEDLHHAVADGATLERVPFDWSQFYWGCDGWADWDVPVRCRRVWTVEEMARLEAGYPSGAATCLGCGQAHAWPHPVQIGSER